MNLYDLARKNITGSAFRSWTVGLCALLVAALVLSSTLILRGAEDSLRLTLDRLGADIIVVPEGTEATVESALLMGTTTRVWMDEKNLATIQAVPGVQAVSPQIYLSTLVNAACCAVSDMFLVVYDPETDFTIEPWLKETLGESLKLGEAVGGHYVFVPEGEQNIQLYAYLLTLRANLEATGTALDAAMFLTIDTARDMARVSETMAMEPLVIPEGKVSAAMVRTVPGAAPDQVALEIMGQIPGVTAIVSANLFQTYRQQMTSLRTSTVASMVITLALSLASLALVFSLAANERRRELGMLRAMGATREFVFGSLLIEAGILAVAGAAAGIVLTVMVTMLFHNLIVHTLNIPFLLPSLQTLMGPVAACMGLALLCIILAAMVPAYRISNMEPATAMRE
jgi:putative ABC transport system permease protein